MAFRIGNPFTRLRETFGRAGKYELPTIAKNPASSKQERILREETLVLEGLTFLTGNEKARKLREIGFESGGTVKEDSVIVAKRTEKGKEVFYLLRKSDGVSEKTTSDFLRILSKKKFATKRENLVVIEEGGVKQVYGAIKIDTQIGGTRFLGKSTEKGNAGYELDTRCLLEDEKLLQDQHFMRGYARLCGSLYVFGEFDDNPANFLKNEKGRVVKIDMGGAFDMQTHPELRDLEIVDERDQKIENPQRYFPFLGSPQARKFLGYYLAKDPHFTDKVAGKYGDLEFQDRDLSQIMVKAASKHFPDDPAIDYSTGVKKQVKVSQVEAFIAEIEENLASKINKEMLERIQANIAAEALQGISTTKDWFIEFMGGLEDAILLCQDQNFLNQYFAKIKGGLVEKGLDEEEIEKNLAEIRNHFERNAQMAQTRFEDFSQYYKTIKTELSVIPESPAALEERRKRQEAAKVKFDATVDTEKRTKFQANQEVFLSTQFFRANKSLLPLAMDSYGGLSFEKDGKKHKINAEQKAKLSALFQSLRDENVVIVKASSSDASLSKTSAQQAFATDNFLSAQEFDRFKPKSKDSPPDSPRPRARAFRGEAELLKRNLNEEVIVEVDFISGSNFGAEFLDEASGVDALQNPTKAMIGILHQTKRGEFLDLTSPLTDENGKLQAGNPILIYGQNTVKDGKTRKSNSLEAPILDIQRRQFSNEEVASYLFQTFSNGFNALQKSFKEAQINIKFDPETLQKSQINPFLILGMQIFAAQNLGVNFILSNGKSQESQEFMQFFKERFLPKFNEILQQAEISDEEKIKQIASLSQNIELTYKRIQQGLTFKDYQTRVQALKTELEKPNSLTEIATGGITKKTTKRFMAALKGEETLQESENSLKRKRLPNIIRATRQRTTREKEFVELVEEAGIMPTSLEGGISGLQKAISALDKELQDSKSTPRIIFETSQTPQTQPTQPIDGISLIKLREGEIQDSKQVKQKVEQVIDLVVQNYSEDEHTNVKAKILVLMEALAEYGFEYLKGINEKDSSLLKEGGDKAGFSKWKEEKEFRNLLQEKCKEKGIEGDFSNSQSDIMREMAVFSAQIQQHSKGVFDEVSGKHYEKDGQKITDMSRSWRMAMALHSQDAMISIGRSVEV